MAPINDLLLKCAIVGSLFVIVAPGVSGCEEYRARRDGITLGLGNANAHNIAVQTVDPWPPYVTDTRIDVDGERARLSDKRYRANEVIDPETQTTQSINRKRD